MKTKIFYIISFVIGLGVSIPAVAQQSAAIYWGPRSLPSWATQHCQQWNKRFGSWNNEWLSTMQPTSDGGFILVGQSDAAPNNPIWIIKTDAGGNQQWQNSYVRAYESQIRSIQSTADGGYILVGHTGTANSLNEFWILKLDGSGALQWQKTWSSGLGQDEAYSVTQTSDNGYVIVGFSYWVIKLNSAGDLVWQKKLEGSMRPYAIKQTTTGEFLIAGDSPDYFNQTANPGDPSDEGAFCVIKTDASGNFLWQVTLGTYRLDGAFDIIQTSDGNYVAAGYTNSFSPVTGDNYDGLVVKISPAGNILWQTRIDHTLYDEIKNIRQTADGGFIFCGSADYPWNDWYGIYDRSDFWVGKLDASGQLTWQGAFGGEREGSAVAVVPTADGGYVVGGTYLMPDNIAQGIAANLDYLLIKLTPGCTIQQVSGHYKRKLYVPVWQTSGPSAQKRSVTTLQASNVTATEVLFRDSLNRLIATVTSGGDHPVEGDVTATVWVDIRQAATYLRRHYEITPDENAATATGTVKLYFSQDDFNEYNRLAGADRKLPSSNEDAVGIANFRIVKYSGVSSDESGAPGSYTGGSNIIIPDEIAWKDSEQIWEVSFDANGFSGFFATDAITAGEALPVTFGAIHAFLKDDVLTVDWTSQSETNNAYYQIEASTDGKTFTAISDKILSRAKDGNSEVPIRYNFVNTYTGIFGASVLLLLSLMGGSNRTQKRMGYILSSLVIIFVIACSKSTSDMMKGGGEDLFIRIAQTDKDGAQTYSKAIKVVKQ